MSRNGLTNPSKEICGGAVVAGRKLKGRDAGFVAENCDEPLPIFLVLAVTEDCHFKKDQADHLNSLFHAPVWPSSPWL